MLQASDFYIDGRWTAPCTPSRVHVVDPADEVAFAAVSLGSPADVDKAVAAALAAFRPWSRLGRDERIGWLEALLSAYDKRLPDIARTISREMGAPIKLSIQSQAAAGSTLIRSFIETLRTFEFEEVLQGSPNDRVLREPIGVCGLITPWNWPMNQVVLKVAAAFAAGCTVVLKPSEIAPLSSMIFAEVVDAAGFPPGVFNLVNGDGPVVGAALASHRDVDLVSFTGSTRAGVSISQGAAVDVKRVVLELGGKSPNLIFADADVEEAVMRGVNQCFSNAGQSCNAPSRMLIERSVYERAVAVAAECARGVRVGHPSEYGDHIGPLASAAQFAKVQELIQAGLEEGARLVAGGPGRPEHLNRGYFVRPTVFADVRNDMRVAREEIFGPVLVMMPFEDEEEAVRIANDTPYGLSGYIQSADRERVHRVARQLRVGMVHVNGARRAAQGPFGGYKQSGLGREGGRWGIEDFLEVKAVSGWLPG